MKRQENDPPSTQHSVSETTEESEMLKTLSESERQKSEIEVHLAEYKALSEFQRDAKATFVRTAIYHNTGIVVVTTWFLQHFNLPSGLVSALISSGYLLPLLLALPIVNAVLIVACAYQVYSFFCVASHFQRLRARLKTLLGRDVLVYEDKFGRSHGHHKELSLVLDVLAAIMWFIIPLILAFTVAIGVPIWIGFPTKHSFWAYCIGTVFSTISILYLLGVITLMLRVRNKPHPLVIND
ncbi:MAG: hypothetical protein QME81_14380 [bacterium]|nr:hypothetical protein [bacterium]